MDYEICKHCGHQIFFSSKYWYSRLDSHHTCSNKKFPTLHEPLSEQVRFNRIIDEYYDKNTVTGTTK